MAATLSDPSRIETDSLRRQNRIIGHAKQRDLWLRHREINPLNPRLQFCLLSRSESPITRQCFGTLIAIARLIPNIVITK